MITATATLPNTPVSTISTRIQSIDLLRGLVMIIMALDHVRDYFHADAFLFNPLDLEKTSAALFITRWITHFCAPVFVFLAGTSAFFVGMRKGKNELTSFLLKRGLWLIVLEFTIINFSWFFNIQFSLLALTVIWALATGMIILSLVIHLPFKVILVTALLIVTGHNLLDPINVEGNDVSEIGWSLLHEQHGFPLGHFFLFVGYPILPWAGIMLLGYCFGKLYQPTTSASNRRKVLIRLGVAMILLFVIIRSINIYGDPSRWSEQPTFLYTFFSFINVTKYPPSLLYTLITLGPAILFLAVSENMKGKFSQYLIALGRVPMFYYIIHLYLIHIIALIAALATGFDASDMVFNTWVTDSPNLRGYGFNLVIVYVIWILVVLALYPLCLWYDRYKINHREKWWLSYL
jgi:uncharacterized membrane protein